MTDPGYVAGGYGVTIVAIGAYVGHMWARGRALSRVATHRGADGLPAKHAPSEEAP